MGAEMCVGRVRNRILRRDRDEQCTICLSWGSPGCSPPDNHRLPARDNREPRTDSSSLRKGREEHFPPAAGIDKHFGRKMRLFLAWNSRRRWREGEHLKQRAP